MFIFALFCLLHALSATEHLAHQDAEGTRCAPIPHLPESTLHHAEGRRCAPIPHLPESTLHHYLSSRIIGHLHAVTRARNRLVVVQRVCDLTGEGASKRGGTRTASCHPKVKLRCRQNRVWLQAIHIHIHIHIQPEQTTRQNILKQTSVYIRRAQKQT